MIKGILITVSCAALVVLFITGSQHEGKQEVKDPVFPAEYTLHFTGFGLVPVHDVRFDPSRVEMRVLSPEPGELAVVGGMAGCREAVACANGSFFDEKNRPLGLIVSGTERIQRLRGTTWGVFWVGRKGRAQIFQQEEFEKGVDVDHDVEFAIQSGPMMLYGGEEQGTRWQLARRTALGLDSAGFVHLLVVPVPVSLSSLAQFALEELKLTHLINLDGGSSTQARIRLSGAEVDIAGDPVANGVGLFYR